MVVSWGQNTTHTIPSRSPAPSTTGGLFGSPAPATGGLFGSPAPSTTSAFGTSSFGSPSPAPSGLFGAPAPSPGGIFGTPSTTSAFGASPAPAFGASPAPAFGSTTTTAAPSTAIPAQAALQAHLDASARQEQAILQNQLQKIHAAYNGSTTNSEKSNPFSTVVYNPLTPELRQWQLVQGLGNNNTHYRPPLPLPRPPSLSDNDWAQALVHAPPDTMPVPLLGAAALQTRLQAQQQQAQQLQQQMQQLKEITDTILPSRFDQTSQRLQALQQRQLQCSQRLRRVWTKTEVVRGLGHPLTVDEVKAQQTMRQLAQQLQQIPLSHGRAPMVGKLEQEKEVKQVVLKHRRQLLEMTYEMQANQRDMDAMKKLVGKSK